MKIILSEVAHVSLVNQRYSYFATLSTDAFLFLHLFPMKYGVIISKSYVALMGDVTPFVTKRYVLVDGVEEIRFLALRNS